MRKISSIIFFFPLMALAKPQKFQPVTVPLEQDDSVIVRGYQGDVEIIPTTKQELRVEAVKASTGGAFDQWNFQVRKKKNQVEVVVKGPDDQEDWNKVRAGQTPVFNLKIMTPSRPIEISWHRGNLQMKKVSSTISAQVTDGKLVAEEGKGTLAVQLISGAVTVKKHNGNVKLQTYKGTVNLAETKGVLILDNHSSRYQVTGHQGGAEIKNYSGPMAIDSMEGALTLFNRSGIITVKKHKGSIKGETDKGNLTVRAERLQSFIFNSQSGIVNLKLPKESGAFVSLRSEKGELQAYKYSNYLQKIRKGLWTELKGQLKGEEQGQVKIVSKYGNIVLR